MFQQKALPKYMILVFVTQMRFIGLLLPVSAVRASSFSQTYSSSTVTTVHNGHRESHSDTRTKVTEKGHKNETHIHADVKDGEGIYIKDECHDDNCEKVETPIRKHELDKKHSVSVPHHLRITDDDHRHASPART